MNTEKHPVFTHSALALMDTGDTAEEPAVDGPNGDAATGGALNAKRTATDRRAHQRIPVLFEVDYRADETFLFAYITDISAMGIFIYTPQPEPPGTHLALHFTPPGWPGLPGAEPGAIECEGDVIWINPPREGKSRNPGMGIRFVGLTAEQRQTILGLVRTFAWLDDGLGDDVQ